MGLSLIVVNNAVTAITRQSRNRLKMLKRQMFGRARFDLLRKRMLLGT